MSSEHKTINSGSQTGPLCPHLAETSAIISAIEYLRSNSANFTFVITRSPMDRESGNLQDSYIAIHKSDTDELAKLPVTLSQGKNIQICFQTSDQGLARIQLTARSWEIWIDTPAVREILLQFNKMIRAGQKARFATSGFAALLVFWPFLLMFILFIIGAATDSRFRGSGQQQFKVENTPAWIDEVLRPVPYLWLLTMICALGIGIVRLQGGGMRRWPERFSKRALILAFHQFRINPLNREATRMVVASIISGVVAAVIAAALIGKK